MPKAGWPPCDNVMQASGYITVPGINGTEKNFFYWLFGPRHSTGTKPRPVVLWLTGGPGCSSSVALALENGPCLIDESGTLRRNTQGWNEGAYLLYVDQPAGVGYSFADTASFVHNESEASEEMYSFLQRFMQLYATPSISGENDFYIFGESYAGHYVPSLAERILRGNTMGKNPIINLRGIAVGNGLTDPYTQYPSYAEVAYDWCKEKLGEPCISYEDYTKMLQLLPTCLDAIAMCNEGSTDASPNCSIDAPPCTDYIEPFMKTGINVYDIRKQCSGDLCYPMNSTIRFFNDPAVKHALGATKKEWMPCDANVGMRFSHDFLRNFNWTIPKLLAADIRVMLYVGDVDWICNWIGNKKWAMSLEWPGKADFNAAPDLEFFVEGKKAGKRRSFNGFSFVQVYDAGHMVPMDQPKVASFLLNEFIGIEKEGS